MDSKPSRAWARSQRAMLVSIVVATLGYFALASVHDGAQTWRALARLGVGGVLLVLALSLLNYALRYWRWQHYLRALGHVVPGARALRYYIAGFGFTTTPGKVGEAVRSLYLKRHDVPYADSLSLFLSERLADTGAMLALSALALAQFPRFATPLALTLALIAALLVLLRAPPVRRWLKRARHPRLQQLRARLDAFLTVTVQLTRPRLLATGLGLGLLAWGAEGIAFYYILQFLGVQVPFATAIGIYSLSILVGAISFLPGGLGSTEATMVLLLLWIGAGHSEAVAATLICRLATLWFAVALGGLAMASIRAPATETSSSGG